MTDCLFQQEASQQQSETNLLQFVDKEQVKKLEQSNILESNTAEGPKQEVTQQSENLHQQNIVQQSNKQIPTTNLASISSNHSEGHQQHIVQQSNTQQIPPSNQANLVMRKTKAASSIPFQMLIPILQPHLDKDRSMQLQAIFTKLRVGHFHIYAIGFYFLLNSLKQGIS